MVSRIFRRVTKPHRKLKRYDAYYEDGLGKFTKAMSFEAFDAQEATDKAIRFATLIQSKFSHIKLNEK